MKYPDLQTVPADTVHCANIEFGQRCANLGAFSHSTFGTGPWYCRQHFFPGDPAGVFPRYDSIATLPDEQKRADYKDWARRILHRSSLGERVPDISIEFARQALRLSPVREPGEEG